MDVLTSLRTYIKDTFLYQAGTEDVGVDDPLLDSGIVDSMGILQLITFLESQFGVLVEDEEIVPENFNTMTSITAFVNRKLEHPTI